MLGEILIVDDHEVVRRGLRTLLSASPDWTIAGEAADGLEGVEKAKALQPSVVLMDISMPRMNGLEATRIIRQALPKSKVVIISQNDPAVARRQAQEVGAHGGIKPEKLSEIQSQGSGVGIRGMRERARHFGGHMLIESNSKGTRISFKFPFSKNPPARLEALAPQDRVVQPVQCAG